MNNPEKLSWSSRNEEIPSTVSSNQDVDEESLSKQKRIRYGQDTRFRKHLAHWVMWIVPLWLLLVLSIIASCGLKWMGLSSNVLITLLATTTANVLGLAYIVLKGISQNEDKKNSL